MNTQNHLISKLVRTALLLAINVFPGSLALALAAATPTVTATLDPDRIAVGDTATFTVTIDGTQAARRPEMPDVDGLEFYPAGQSRGYQSINGRTSVSVGYRFTVHAGREGRIEIPPIAIDIDGNNLRTESVTLTVSKGSQLPASRTGPQRLAPAPPNWARGRVPVAPDMDDSAMLAVTLPDRNADSAYVGELIPIKLEAYFREGAQVSLTSKPTIDGQAFTLHNITDEPTQEVRLVNGEPYRVLTWHGGLSAVKAGSYPVKVQLDATVAVRQPRSPGNSHVPQGPGRLNDPFFDRFFNGVFEDFFAPMVEKDVRLTGGERELEVQPLPEAGRPQNFSGAVGQFQIRSFSLPAAAHTGEPVKVRVSIDGSGNFDRVSCPELMPGDNWKTYQPKSEFQAHDAAGFQGSRTFEQNAVPVQPGTIETRFSFTYFDPQTGSYEKAESESVALAITGNPLAQGVGSTNGAAATNAADDGAGSSSRDSGDAPTGLAPLKPNVGRVVDLTPLYQRPWFLALQCGLVVMIIVGFVAERVRRRAMDPDAVAARKTRRRLDCALEAVEHARIKADPAAFFLAARHALQIRAGSRSHRNPETLTGADFAIGSTAKQIFELADAAEYSRVSVDPEELSQWRIMLDQALHEVPDNA